MEFSFMKSQYTTPSLQGTRLLHYQSLTDDQCKKKNSLRGGTLKKKRISLIYKI